MPLYSPQELSRRNVRRMQEIFDTADVDFHDRLGYGQLAYNMIKDGDYQNPGHRWGAFLNALEMVVQGFHGATKPRSHRSSKEDERDEGEQIAN